MDLLVSCDWLVGALGAEDLRILDATSFLPAYAAQPAGRVSRIAYPRALFLDLSTLKDVEDPRLHEQSRPTTSSRRAWWPSASARDGPDRRL